RLLRILGYIHVSFPIDKTQTSNPRTPTNCRLCCVFRLSGAISRKWITWSYPGVTVTRDTLAKRGMRLKARRSRHPSGLAGIRRFWGYGRHGGVRAAKVYAVKEYSLVVVGRALLASSSESTTVPNSKLAK